MPVTNIFVTLTRRRSPVRWGSQRKSHTTTHTGIARDVRGLLATPRDAAIRAVWAYGDWLRVDITTNAAGTASEQKASPLHRSGLEGTCVCLAVLVMRRELTFRGPCQVFFRWVTGWTWEPVISETPTPTGDRFEID